jgi:hypothetical protein
MHVLNVLECAKALVAALAATGGIAKADVSQEGVRDALRALFEQTSKLQVYESRAAARGTLSKLDDEKLALAIKEVRDRRILTVGEEDVLAATAEQVDAAFSLDADPSAVPEVADEPAPESGERSPEDLFAL